MVTQAEKNKVKGNGDKPKARRLAIAHLVVVSAFERTFSTGRSGWFGQVQDAQTGEKYQIIGAVKLG